jgi:iron complex outermembrane receptor protein
MLAAQYNFSLSKKQDLKIVLRGEWKYLGTQFFDLANTIRQSSYHLLNTRAGLTAKNFEILFLDEKYHRTKNILAMLMILVQFI